MLLWVLAYLGGLLDDLEPLYSAGASVCSEAGRTAVPAQRPAVVSGYGRHVFAGRHAHGGRGGWVVQANEWGRWLALVVLTLFALTLFFPSLAEWISDR